MPRNKTTPGAGKNLLPGVFPPFGTKMPNMNHKDDKNYVYVSGQNLF